MEAGSILAILPRSIRTIYQSQCMQAESLREIRLRAGKPLIFKKSSGETKLNYIVSKGDIDELLSYISRYSLYAYEEEMRQGFITIEGGHRVGLSGQVIMENGHVKNFRYVSAVNIRISHEVKGCGNDVIPYITDPLHHTLIISPPGCGKTTLLRDLIRQISGNTMNVGVVDERSELGGCHKGVPQNDLGIRTDILDGCPKAEGMMMLIRTMAPDVIAVDEIGTEDDVHAIAYVMHCGCKILATVHGSSLEEVRRKPVLGPVIQSKQFERYILLGNERKTGEVKAIYDQEGRRLL